MYHEVSNWGGGLWLFSLIGDHHDKQGLEGGGECYRRIYGISFSEGKSGFTGAFTDSDPNPLGEVVEGEFAVKLRGAK